MKIDSSLYDSILLKLEEKKIDSLQSVSGGSIHEALRIVCGKKSYFLKFNSSSKFPGIFESESKGLDLLRSTNELSIPNTLGIGETKLHSYLLLEFIQKTEPNAIRWRNFGKSIARLHKNSSTTFGLNHSNYIGSLIQSNKSHSNWNEFFAEERINAQLKLAIDSKNISGSFVKKFDRLLNTLDSIFPKENAALLHGDLWSGNFIAAENTFFAIDPSVYYGFREMDLAMSKLFGGFDPEFYFGYQEEFPLEVEWEERIDVCNLYPLMVHLNLFGSSYLSQIESTLKKFN